MPRLAALIPAPPLSLTASDGTGLRLRRVQARAVLAGPLAFTELHLAFENPLDRTLEGTFRMALPPGASISRFAMKIDASSWQEGEVVERQAARVAYEDFLHRKQDPALLEQSAGNEFSARVFPIAGRSIKEITLSFAQELAGDTPYVLPLAGLPQVDDVDVEIAGADAAAPKGPATRLSEHAWTPQQDVVVPRSGARAGDGLRSGELVLARVRPVVERHPDPIASAVVLLDTSASRALGLEDQIRALQGFASKLDPEARLVVACFDQGVQEVLAGRARDLGAEVAQKIRGRGALGASDLAGALAWAGERARSAGATRVVVVSDGIATLGDVDGAKIVDAARALGGAGVERVDAVAVGGIRDEATLRRLATAGLAHDGVVVDGSIEPGAIARRLGESTRSHVSVAVEGARWQWPQAIDGAQADDEFLVYAEVGAVAEARVSIDGAPARPLALTRVDRPLLERAVAQARIASMLDEEARGGDIGALRRGIVALSMTSRVMSPYTAMLVLESDADYARFGIDRRAPVDILTVAGGRVVRTVRAAGAPAPAAPPSTGTPATAAIEKARRPRAVPAGAPASDAPVAPWGRDEDDDPGEARGQLFGGAIGDAFGAGGLGLSGAGAGDGANEGGSGSAGGEAAQFGMIGLLAGAASSSAAAAAPSDGANRLPSEESARGTGSGHGRLGGSHAVRAPALRAGAVATRASAAPSSPGAAARESSEEGAAGAPAYSGRFASVMLALEGHDATVALARAAEWHAQEPGDAMALVALGEALEATGDRAQASRAYGSLIDLFPARADMRRFAGERLERVADEAALDVAIDTYRKAVQERPDHPSSHRLLAFALAKRARFADAFDAALAALAHRYPQGRFPGVDRVLHEDLALVGAAWAHREPARRDEIAARVRAAGAAWEDAPSLRFVLSWETDSNDVDFHIVDRAGQHAYYASPRLASGGELYADVTTGYGPECFTIRAAHGRRAGPYKLQAHYFARGPMGYGMGKLEIVAHDGRGALSFEERPFVVMNDRAFVDLGTY
jgi:tetratricopeptide (TPR) repeat protein